MLANIAAAHKLLHYVLDMPNISEQLINNLLLQVIKNVSALVNVKFKLTNQSCSSPKINQSPIFNGAVVISTIIFMKLRRPLFLW